jgi:Flp pilus assembly pilin Flp
MNMNSKLNKRVIGGKKQLGQGMTEYIIIVALIAIAAIGVYSAFGHTLKNQVSGVTAGIAGNGARATASRTAADQTSAAAQQEAQRAVGLDNYDQGVRQR